MPRRSSVPSDRRHNQSNQAIVTLTDGQGHRQDVFLGKFDSPASRSEYLRVLAEWEASGRQLRKPSTIGSTSDITLNEFMARYTRFVEGYYVIPAIRRTERYRHGPFRLLQAGIRQSTRADLW